MVRNDPDGVPIDGSVVRWPNAQHYTLLSMCRAIIIVIDLFNLDTVSDPDFVILHEQSQRQTVLMIRTGEESHLSAPISFESIKADCLALARTDVAGNNIDSVRVSLAIAVEFIANLQRREEAAFPNSRDRSAIDRGLCPAGEKQGVPDQCPSADSWANEVMQKAEEKEYDNVFLAWDAIRRVKASKRRESVGKLTPYHFN